MSRSAYGIAAAAFLLIGCHSIKEELPTQPTNTPASGGVLTIPIPKIPLSGTPAPKATPTPAPKATAHSDAHAGSDAHSDARRPRPPRPAAAGAATRCRRTSPA